jgi:Rieske Fe-S protein
VTCPSSSNSERLDFSAYPQLANAGGSVSFQGSTYSDPGCGQPDIIVVARGAGQFLAFSASCSHNCCTVNYTGSAFRCPCHNANFNLTGACTNGVAPLPLSALKVCADSTGVTVSW